MRLWLIVPLAAAAFAQDPAQIFKTTCAGCHGLDSMGGEHAPALNLDRPDAEVLQLIRNGIPSSGMPAFGKKLTSEQIQNLITYVRQLQPMETGLAVEAKLPFDLWPSEGS
jgi:mono/diheme cytochrome c family protein